MAETGSISGKRLSRSTDEGIKEEEEEVKVVSQFAVAAVLNVVKRFSLHCQTGSSKGAQLADVLCPTKRR